MSTELGEWIKSSRIEAHLTQGELAEKIGVSQGAVSAWEVGRSEPRPVEIVKLEELFGKRPAELSEWLKNSRIEADLTQGELAEKLGVTQAAISTWETGTSVPRSAELSKLESLFGKPKVKSEESENVIGEWLETERRKRKLTQEELAEKTGLTQVGISSIETGRTKSPQKRTLQKLINFLGSPPKFTEEQIEEEKILEGIGEFFCPFPVKEWKQYAEEVPCIYVIYDKSNRPIRIGETKDLKRRLNEYEQNYWWFRPPTSETFAYVVIKEQDLLEKAEKIFIKLAGSHAIFNTQYTL